MDLIHEFLAPNSVSDLAAAGNLRMWHHGQNWVYHVIFPLAYCMGKASPVARKLPRAGHILVIPQCGDGSGQSSSEDPIEIGRGFVSIDLQ